ETLGAIWDLTPDLSIQIEAVHRLTSVGAVVTHVQHGTSTEGFDAEWRSIELMTVDVDRINYCEIFDEADLDAALARFDELSQPVRRLENAASRALDRLYEYFRTRNWAALAEILTDHSVVDDRHDVVNSGFWDGRDTVIANLQALADAAPTTSTVIATRGERLALSRMRSPNRNPQYGDFSSDMLVIAEIDADHRIAAQLAFDADDVDAAFEELDARYVAGEAAAHSRTWSVIARAYASFNKHETPATTPDSVAIEHRPLLTVDAVDLAESI